jgi:hypothetical protein
MLQESHVFITAEMARFLADECYVVFCRRSGHIEFCGLGVYPVLFYRQSEIHRLLSSQTADGSLDLIRVVTINTLNVNDRPFDDCVHSDIAALRDIPTGKHPP